MDVISFTEDANHTSKHFNTDIKLYLKGFMHVQLYGLALRFHNIHTEAILLEE